MLHLREHGLPRVEVSFHAEVCGRGQTVEGRPPFRESVARTDCKTTRGTLGYCWNPPDCESGGMMLRLLAWLAGALALAQATRYSADSNRLVVGGEDLSFAPPP